MIERAEADRLADLHADRGMADHTAGMDDYAHLYPIFREAVHGNRLGYMRSWDSILEDGFALRSLPAFFAWMREQGHGPWVVTVPVHYTLTELRDIAYGRIDFDTEPYNPDLFAPWHDTIRRFVQSAERTSLPNGHDEARPHLHNTLGHLLAVGPREYPTTIPLFVAWMEGQMLAEPDVHAIAPQIVAPVRDELDLSPEGTPTWLEALPPCITDQDRDREDGAGYHSPQESLVEMLALIHQYGLEQFRPFLSGWGPFNSGERDVINEPGADIRYTAGFLNHLAEERRLDVPLVPVTTTLSEGAPMNPLITDFIARYNLITETNPQGTGVLDREEGHGAQAAFHAAWPQMSLAAQDSWRTAYNLAIAERRFEYASVSTFDHSTGPVWSYSYGYSTINFFIACRVAGVTIHPATGAVLLPGQAPAAVPSGDTVRTAWSTEDLTIDYIEAHHDDFTAYLREHGWRVDGYVQSELRRTEDQPGYTYVLRDRMYEGFAAWLTEHGRPIPTATAPVVTIESLRAMSREDRLAAHLAPYRAYLESIGHRWSDEANATYTLGSLDELFVRASMGEDAVVARYVEHLAALRPEGSTTPTTTEATITDTTPAEPVAVIPIGPDHPDWVAFAQRMADIATRNSMCPEYDRIARLMDLPTRKTEILTRITIDVPMVLERGNNVDDRALREAALALLAQSGSVSRANRTEVSRREVVG